MSSTAHFLCYKQILHKCTNDNVMCIHSVLYSHCMQLVEMFKERKESVAIGGAQAPRDSQDLYAVEGFSYQEKISLRKLGLLARSRCTLCAVLQGMPGSLPWGVLLTFLNDFLAQKKGMSIASATWVRLRTSHLKR